MSEERLETLETKHAYQEAMVQDLSTQLYTHERRLERLEELVAQLAEKLKGLAAGETAPLPERERPPHY